MRRETKLSKERQRRVFDYVKGYIEEHGIGPMNRMIAEQLGLRTPVVSECLRKLEDKGWLYMRQRYCPTTLEVLSHPSQTEREVDVLDQGRAYVVVLAADELMERAMDRQELVVLLRFPSGKTQALTVDAGRGVMGEKDAACSGILAYHNGDYRYSPPCPAYGTASDV